jgi:hypothetical protein
MTRTQYLFAAGLIGTTLLSAVAFGQAAGPSTDTTQIEVETTDVKKGKDGINNGQCGGRDMKGASNQGNGGTVKGPGDANGKSGQGNGAGNGCVIVGKTTTGNLDFSGGSNNGNGGKVR